MQVRNYINSSRAQRGLTTSKVGEHTEIEVIEAGVGIGRSPAHCEGPRMSGPTARRKPDDHPRDRAPFPSGRRPRIAAARVGFWPLMRRLAPAAGAARPGPPPPFSVPVATDKGQVQGYPGIEPGVVAFLGIPFGAASGRRVAVESAAAGRAVAGRARRQALQARVHPGLGPAALQERGGRSGRIPPAASEDCLYLNVWTGATAPGEKRPVMLWLYGGAYTDGGGNSPYQRGDHLAANGAVVVSMNYRLGGLGFLVHPDLAKESGHNASGNYALADAIAA